jgi:uncharacterized protein involved in outer membrane biogenesis
MRWKTVIVVALVFAVALLAGLSVFVGTYDYDKLIPGIVHAAKESTGRELVVSGQARFKTGLYPARSRRLCSTSLIGSSSSTTRTSSP